MTNIALDPEYRRKVTVIEDYILTLPPAIGGKCKRTVRHHFTPGLCAREMDIPAGYLVTGAVHLRENMNVLAKGRISVLTGDGMKELAAPAVVVSPPGMKRVGIAHEDTTWITFFLTELTDPDEIERVFSVPDYKSLPAGFLEALLEIEQCPSA